MPDWKLFFISALIVICGIILVFYFPYSRENGMFREWFNFPFNLGIVFIVLGAVGMYINYKKNSNGV